MPEDNQNNSSQATEVTATTSNNVATESVIEKPVASFADLFDQDQDYGNLSKKSLFRYDSGESLANKDSKKND